MRQNRQTYCIKASLGNTFMVEGEYIEVMKTHLWDDKSLPMTLMEIAQILQKLSSERVACEYESNKMDEWIQNMVLDGSKARRDTSNFVEFNHERKLCSYLLQDFSILQVQCVPHQCVRVQRHLHQSRVHQQQMKNI